MVSFAGADGAGSAVIDAEQEDPDHDRRNQHGEGDRNLDDKRHALRARRREDQAVLRDDPVNATGIMTAMKANAITAVT
jgi:hypothetical protein